jgi:hypothetical protein
LVTATESPKSGTSERGRFPADFSVLFPKNHSATATNGDRFPPYFLFSFRAGVGRRGVILYGLRVHVWILTPHQYAPVPFIMLLPGKKGADFLRVILYMFRTAATLILPILFCFHCYHRKPPTYKPQVLSDLPSNQYLSTSGGPYRGKNTLHPPALIFLSQDLPLTTNPTHSLPLETCYV